MLKKLFQTALVFAALAVTGWLFHWAMQDNLSITSATSASHYQTFDERGGLINVTSREPQTLDIILRNSSDIIQPLSLSLSKSKHTITSVSIDGKLVTQSKSNAIKAQPIRLMPMESIAVTITITPAQIDFIEVVFQPIS